MTLLYLFYAPSLSNLITFAQIWSSNIILRHCLRINGIYRIIFYPKVYNITIWILFSSSLGLIAGTDGECGVANVVFVGDLLANEHEVDASCGIFVVKDADTGFMSELFISISLRSPLFILFTAILEKAVTILLSGMYNVISSMPQNHHKTNVVDLDPVNNIHSSMI